MTLLEALSASRLKSRIGPERSPINRNLLPELSNCYCHPGKAGGSPIAISAGAHALCATIASRYSMTMKRTLSAIALLLFLSASLSAEKKFIRPEGYNRGLPFTPGILVDGTLYVAGFSGEDPQTGAVPKEFESEVKQALDKIGVILKAADMQYSDVVSVQVYLTDMKLFERMNNVYRNYFPEPRPTRTIAGIAKLIGRSRIEITVTARK